jgi:hypothetical protein
MGDITFGGDPPYALPVAQSTSASAEGEIVEVVLRVSVPGKLPSPAPIRIQMTTEVARTLHAQLQPAIIVAEARARRR